MHEIDDECGYPGDYGDEIAHIVDTRLSDKTEVPAYERDLKIANNNFSLYMKTPFKILESFADLIIIIGFGIGLCVLIAVPVHMWHNQQKTQAEKERSEAAKEYEELSKDGVKPWQEIIKHQSEAKRFDTLDNNIAHKLDYWWLNSPIGKYNYDEYAMRMQRIASALNFLENDTRVCAGAMQKIRALNTRCTFMQKIISEYRAAGPFSKTTVKTENGSIIFQRSVNVNAQTLQLEMEDFRKQVAEFAYAWLSDSRSPAGQAIRSSGGAET